MKVRITGSRRATKTVASPWRWNQRSARSRSWCDIRMYFPYFSISGRPPYIPR